MTKSMRIRFYLFWTLSIILEYPALVLFFNPEFQSNPTILLQSLSAHLMSSTCLFFSYPKHITWFYHKRKWPQFFFNISFFLPILGHLIVIVIYLSFQKKEFGSHEIFEEADHFLNQTNRALFERRQFFSQKQKIKDAINFLPLVDILEGNDLALKRSAIDKLSSLSNPDSIRTLKKYKDDESSEVRFFVTSAILRIKKDFEEEIEYAKKQIQKNPDEIGLKLAVSNLYLRFYHSHLLEDHDAEPLLNNAAFQLESALKIDPKNKTVLQKLLECYRIQNNDNEVLNTAQKLVNLDAINLNEYNLIEIQTLYRKRNFSKITPKLKELDKATLDKQWSAFSSWWTAGT